MYNNFFINITTVAQPTLFLTIVALLTKKSPRRPSVQQGFIINIPFLLLSLSHTHTHNIYHTSSYSESNLILILSGIYTTVLIQNLI